MIASCGGPVVRLLVDCGWTSDSGPALEAGGDYTFHGAANIGCIFRATPLVAAGEFEGFDTRKFLLTD